MEKNRNELNQKEMEIVTGGGLSPVDDNEKKLPTRITGRAYCRACHKEMATYGALYRCQTAICEESGKDKTAAEVDWH